MLSLEIRVVLPAVKESRSTVGTATARHTLIVRIRIQHHNACLMAGDTEEHLSKALNPRPGTIP